VMFFSVTTVVWLSKRRVLFWLFLFFDILQEKERKERRRITHFVRCSLELIPRRPTSFQLVEKRRRWNRYG
jgi:hypothetical protein